MFVDEHFINKIGAQVLSLKPKKLFMWLRTLHSCENMTSAVQVSLWLSASQCAKPQFEFGGYATSPNILNPICGTVNPGARK